MHAQPCSRLLSIRCHMWVVCIHTVCQTRAWNFDWRPKLRLSQRENDIEGWYRSCFFTRVTEVCCVCTCVCVVCVSVCLCLHAHTRVRARVCMYVCVWLMLKTFMWFANCLPNWSWCRGCSDAQKCLANNKTTSFWQHTGHCGIIAATSCFTLYAIFRQLFLT